MELVQFAFHPDTADMSQFATFKKKSFEVRRRLSELDVVVSRLMGFLLEAVLCFDGQQTNLHIHTNLFAFLRST